MTTNANNRIHYAGLDVLRMLSMFLIVMLHVISVGEILNNVHLDDKNYLLVWLLRIITAVGVNSFALLSGWLGVMSRHRWVSLVKLWGQAVFWSIGCYLLSWCWGSYAPCLRDIVYGAFPVSFGSWWYLSSYFLLFLAMPYLDEIIRRNVPPIGLFLVTMGLCLMVCPIISGNFSSATLVGNGVVLLGYLYMVGGWLRLREERVLELSGWLLVALWGVGFAGSLGVLFVLHRPELAISNFSPFVILSSVSLLLLFARIKETRRGRGAKILRIASALSFGVYLIHFHPRFRSLFINGRFVKYANSSQWECLYGILYSAAVIYVACALMDFLRWAIVRKLWEFRRGQGINELH